MGYNKSSRKFKQPTFATEFSFVSLNLLFLKLYSTDSYQATSYFSVCLPLMVYLVITLFGNLLKFIQMMHIEDDETPGSGGLFNLLTRKQTKLLTKVIMSLMAYFGVYFLSAQLDLHLVASDQFEKI